MLDLHVLNLGEGSPILVGELKGIFRAWYQYLDKILSFKS